MTKNKYYVKGTNILARVSFREYSFALMRKTLNGEYIVLSCHSTRENAMAVAKSLRNEFMRHPQDFSSWYRPTDIDFFRICELEIRDK